MNKILAGVVVGVVLGGAITWMFLHHDEDAHEHGAEKAASAKHEENPLQLNAEKRAAAGIMLADPKVKPLPAELTAHGRVLDPSPLIALLAEMESARATLAAAEKEFARVKQLHEQDGNASAQSVETAEAAVLRERAQLLGHQARLIAGWGAAVARRPDLPKFVGALAAQEVAIARIDLMGTTAPATAPREVRVATLSQPDASLTAEVLGPAPSVDPQSQGAGYLLLLNGRPPAPGAALTAWLPADGAPREAAFVPASAIVYHDGSAWVYTLEEKDTFERHRVEIARSAGDDVAITHGLEPNAHVVTQGAQQLLSAELQAGSKD